MVVEPVDNNTNKIFSLLTHEPKHSRTFVLTSNVGKSVCYKSFLYRARPQAGPAPPPSSIFNNNIGYKIQNKIVAKFHLYCH